MISFKNFLTEIFDRPYEFSNPHRGLWQFRTDDSGLYTVIIEKAPRRDEKSSDYFIRFKYNPNISSYSHEYSLTKKNKNHFRILATVKKIIFDYFENQKFIKNDSISFSTAEAASVPLYTKLAQSIAKKYQMELKTEKYGVLMEFNLKR